MVVAAAVVPKAVEAVGKKRAYIVAGVVAAVAARRLRAGARLGCPAIGIACYGVLGFGLGAINALIFALQADTVEYGEWRSGVRAEGASYAVLSFTRKVGPGHRRGGGGVHDRSRRLRLRRGDAERRRA